jgi:16S rRNA (cytosine1402-N4)-methyltransferase
MDTSFPETPHRRRPRYQGSHPRSFTEKYKELNPEKYKDDIEKIISRGDTPAGTHRPICVQEVLDILQPKAGEIAVDATLGYGGHTREIIPKLLPHGRLFGFDVDLQEQTRTVARLRDYGFGSNVFTAIHSNFAALPQVLFSYGLTGVDLILADLGISSMQIDNPQRGFTFKRNGPLDMRMNPERGHSAAEFLASVSEKKLTQVIRDNSMNLIPKK